MSIAIDLRSLRKFWSLEAGHLSFVLEAHFGDGEPDVADLTEIVAGIRHQLMAGGTNPADVEQWIRTRHGWAAVMTHAHTVDHGLEWLEMFTKTWGNAVDGTVTGGPSPTRLSTRDPSPQLTANLWYTSGDLVAIPRNDRSSLWLVEEKVTRHVVEQAISWAHLQGGRQYVHRGDPGDGCTEPVDLDYGLALTQAINRYGYCSVTCRLERPLRQRSFNLRPHGQAVFQVTDPTLDWRTRLDQVRQVLSWSPPLVDYGYVRHGVGGSLVGDSGQTWPHVRGSDVRYNRPLLASFVPDAFGIQLLTDAHLERAHDLSQWDITSYAGGRHLVSARDLEAWFGPVDGRDERGFYVAEALPPSDELVAQARADFGGMILTPHLIADNDPWRASTDPYDHPA